MRRSATRWSRLKQWPPPQRRHWDWVVPAGVRQSAGLGPRRWPVVQPSVVQRSVVRGPVVQGPVVQGPVLGEVGGVGPRGAGAGGERSEVAGSWLTGCAHPVAEVLASQPAGPRSISKPVVVAELAGAVRPAADSRPAVVRQPAVGQRDPARAPAASCVAVSVSCRSQCDSPSPNGQPPPTASSPRCRFPLSRRDCQQGCRLPKPEAIPAPRSPPAPAVVLARRHRSLASWP